MDAAIQVQILYVAVGVSFSFRLGQKLQRGLE